MPKIFKNAEMFFQKSQKTWFDENFVFQVFETSVFNIDVRSRKNYGNTTRQSLYIWL